MAGSRRAGEHGERKYWTALALYLLLGLLAWNTLGTDAVSVFGRTVPLRAVPLFVLAAFAFRTWVARQANRIRREHEERGV